MRGLLGILIYLIVSILSSQLKKAASEKSRRVGLPRFESEPLFPSFEYDVPPVEIPVMDHEGQPESNFAEGNQELGLEEVGSDRGEDEENTDVIRRGLDDPSEFPREVRVGWNATKLTEAIILSEIIREPRALRRWPRR